MAVPGMDGFGLAGAGVARADAGVLCKLQETGGGDKGSRTGRCRAPAPSQVSQHVAIGIATERSATPRLKDGRPLRRTWQAKQRSPPAAARLYRPRWPALRRWPPQRPRGWRTPPGPGTGPRRPPPWNASPHVCPQGPGRPSRLVPPCWRARRPRARRPRARRPRARRGRWGRTPPVQRRPGSRQPAFLSCCGREGAARASRGAECRGRLVSDSPWPPTQAATQVARELSSDFSAFTLKFLPPTQV